MIIWLASYPKSGNTWVRAFISSLVYSENGLMNKKLWQSIPQFPIPENFEGLISDKDVFYLKKKEHVFKLFEQLIAAQDKLNLNNKIKFLKTHFLNCKIDKYNFTDQNNTLGTIHIVRDPRNVISSLKNHFSLNNYNEACEFLFKEQNWIFGREDRELLYAPTLLSSWGTHYNMWKQAKKNYLLIKYEDLINDPFKEFKKIKIFIEDLLKIKIDIEKFENAIQSTSFDKLKKMENQNEFFENSIEKNNKKIDFFKLGKNNKWEKLLNKDLASMIEKKFLKEMKELEYI
tara:strand:+ start:221 stop:1084 length:864 start_codon:yes stop_codon:yes gene_type:complete